MCEGWWGDFILVCVWVCMCFIYQNTSYYRLFKYLLKIDSSDPVLGCFLMWLLYLFVSSVCIAPLMLII